MYNSCNLILHGLCFFSDNLVSCCYSPVDKIDNQKPPMISNNYHGEIIDKQELFDYIRKYSNMFKCGETPPQCKGCCHIKNDEWDEGEYINSITISHFSVCNADCIYCSNNLEREERTNEVYKIMPFLRYMKENGIIKEGVELHIGGGEFTIYPEMDELLKEFGTNKFAKIFVPTNVVKYSETLNEALIKGNTFIICSLDAGTRNTFKKLKRIDAFNQVIENLKKYSEKAAYQITLKYIIVPTYNDNMSEYKNFVKIAKELGINCIRTDIDARYARSLNHKIDNYYIELAEKMGKYAEEQGLNHEFYSFLEQCIKDYVPKKENIFIKLKKFIKRNFFNKEIKDLYKNRKYC